jgi:hypothetical protein
VEFRGDFLRFAVFDPHSLKSSLHALGAKGALSESEFTWHAPTFSWIRPEGWNGLPEDFCDWLVSAADPAPVELGPAGQEF